MRPSHSTKRVLRSEPPPPPATTADPVALRPVSPSRSTVPASLAATPQEQPLGRRRGSGSLADVIPHGPSTVDDPGSSYLHRIAARSENLLETRDRRSTRMRDRMSRLGLTTKPMKSVLETDGDLQRDLDRATRRREIAIRDPGTNNVRVYRRAKLDVSLGWNHIGLVPVNLPPRQRQGPGDLPPSQSASPARGAPSFSTSAGGGGATATANANGGYGFSRSGTPLPKGYTHRPYDLDSESHADVEDTDIEGRRQRSEWELWIREREEYDPDANRNVRRVKRRVRHHRTSCRYSLYSNSRQFRQLALQTTFPHEEIRSSLKAIRHAAHGGSNGESLEVPDVEGCFAPMYAGWWGESMHLDVRGGERGTSNPSSPSHATPRDPRNRLPAGNATPPPGTSLVSGSVRPAPLDDIGRDGASVQRPGTTPHSTAVDPARPRRLSRLSSIADVDSPKSTSELPPFGAASSAKAMGNHSTRPSRRASSAAGAPLGNHHNRHLSAGSTVDNPQPTSELHLRVDTESPQPGGAAETLQTQRGGGPFLTEAHSHPLPPRSGTPHTTFSLPSPVHAHGPGGGGGGASRPTTSMDSRCRTPNMAPYAGFRSRRPHVEPGRDFWDCSCTDRSTDDELEGIRLKHHRGSYSAAADARLECWRRGFQKSKVLGRARLGSRLNERAFERQAVCGDRRHFSNMAQEAESNGSSWSINRAARCHTPATSSLWHVHFSNMAHAAERLLEARTQWVRLCDACEGIHFPADATDEVVAEELRQHFIRCDPLTPDVALDVLRAHGATLLPRKVGVRFVDVLRRQAGVPIPEFVSVTQDQVSKLQKEAALRSRNEGGATERVVPHELETMLKRLQGAVSGPSH